MIIAESQENSERIIRTDVCSSDGIKPAPNQDIKPRGTIQYNIKSRQDEAGRQKNEKQGGGGAILGAIDSASTRISIFTQLKLFTATITLQEHNRLSTRFVESTNCSPNLS